MKTNPTCAASRPAGRRLDRALDRLLSRGMGPAYELVRGGALTVPCCEAGFHWRCPQFGAEQLPQDLRRAPYVVEAHRVTGRHCFRRPQGRRFSAKPLQLLGCACRRPEANRPCNASRLLEHRAPQKLANRPLQPHKSDSIARATDLQRSSSADLSEFSGQSQNLVSGRLLLVSH